MNEQAEAPHEPFHEPAPPSADFMLRILVKMARKGDESPVTLFVKGTVISGFLIGQRKYLEHFAALLTRGWDDDEAVAEIRDSFGLNEPETLPDDSEEDDDAAPPWFIHLRDAKVFSPGQPLAPENSLIWRGRLSEVDGYSHGIFQNTG